MTAPLPPDEADRLQELRDFEILDTPTEQEYDDLVYLASQICGTPIALMSLIDAHRQWMKARIGLASPETPRDVAFCSHAILKPQVMVVNDAQADPRFADNPLVTSDPNIRFYAGTPLVTPQGHAVGTLCVIDRVPRSLTPEQVQSLEALGRQVVVLLQLRRAKVAVEAASRTKDQLLEVVKAEREKSDRLLHSLFPSAIAERLRNEAPGCIAEEYHDATILFADINDFWRLAAARKPTEIIELLNHVFSLFDRLAGQHGVQKIKTVGDAYLAAAGLPERRDDHAKAIAEFALGMQREIVGLASGRRDPLSIRIGIHTGPVVAGVVGTRKMAYDLWGPTVNLAHQMESTGVPGGIHVTAATHERLQGEYLFEPRGEFYVKGQGEVATYLLRGRRR